MTSRSRAAAMCLALFVLVSGCTSSGKARDGAGSSAADGRSGSAAASGSTAGRTSTGSSAKASGSSGPGASSSGSPGSTRAVPGSVPTSLSALPPVPGASGTRTPPITPSGKLTCPSGSAVSRAFGSTYGGDPHDLDPSPSNLLCNYVSPGSAPKTLVLSAGDSGHEGYVREAANMRTVADPGASVQPVLGLGDEAVVDMENDGSQTYAAQLLVRYQERNVLIVSNDRASSLQRLAQVSQLLY